MKILITTDWYKPVINGVVTSVISLSNGLTALGHDVKILTLAGNRHSHIENNVTYIGSVGVGKIYPNARLKAVPSSRYIKELIQWSPDVVHSQCEFSTFFLARKVAEACDCPLIHTYHTVYEDFTHYFSPSIRFGKYMSATLSRKVLSKTEAVIVPTVKIKDMLHGYGVHTPITAIPSGLELEQFTAAMSREERNQRREKLGIKENDQVLIYLGRLAKEKNIEEVLNLLQQHPDKKLRLLLVGDGPQSEQLKALVHHLCLEKQVVFAGMVPPKEVASYYKLGDIFVSASQSETQGLTYIEAMACGLPLLCKYDPCLDGVIENGVNGFTYTAAADFQQSLDTLLSVENQRQKMGAAAADTVMRHYSAIGFAQGVLNVYEKELENKRHLITLVSIPCA